MKAVLNNAIKYLVNTDSRFKRVVKSIYFMMPFGFLYCLFFSKRFKNRIDLILGLKYYYNLNGLDYIDPNLNMRFSKMHLWGGVFYKK